VSRWQQDCSKHNIIKYDAATVQYGRVVLSTYVYYIDYAFIIIISLILYGFYFLRLSTSRVHPLIIPRITLLFSMDKSYIVDARTVQVFDNSNGIVL